MVSFGRQLGLEAKIWILSGVVAALTLVAYATLVAPLGAGPSSLDVPWWALAAGFLAAERCVVHLHFRRSAHSFSLGDLPLVVRPAVRDRERPRARRARRHRRGAAARPRLPPIKLVFNLAQFTLATCLAADRRPGLATAARRLGPQRLAGRVARDPAAAALSITVLLIGLCDLDLRGRARREERSGGCC